MDEVVHIEASDVGNLSAKGIPGVLKPQNLEKPRAEKGEDDCTNSACDRTLVSNISISS